MTHKTQTATEILTEAGLEKSYWGKRIIAAEKTGSFTQKDKLRSGDWTTCACGEQSENIERHLDGVPKDRMLAVQGVLFCKCVLAALPLQAALCLIGIERRAGELLAGKA